MIPATSSGISKNIICGPFAQLRVARAGDRVGHCLDDRRRCRPVVAAGKTQHGHLQ